MSVKKQFLLILLLLFLGTLLIYLPIIINPSIYLNRNNDLEEFFWPIYYLVKQQILINHTFPLWNNLFLSGMPLLPDPQSPLFYPPNIIFLFLPLGVAFIISSFIHTLIGGIGIFLLSKKALKFSFAASLFSATLYIFSPKIGGYLEAGHFGLITSFAWLPFVFLGTLMLTKKPRVLESLVLAFGLAGTFYTHTITFIIATISALTTFIISFLMNTKKQDKKKAIFLFTLGWILIFGLIAITLLPQLDWFPQTTRSLLVSERDVYPKWLSKKEFIEAIFSPWIEGSQKIWQLDSEKWIPLGIFTVILALIGFIKLKFSLKIIVSFIVLLIIIVSANNVSPLYSLLSKQDWFVLVRVATRFWFIVVFLVTLLAGYGLNILAKSNVKKILIIAIAVFSLLELLYLNWARIEKPISSPTQPVNKQLLEFLKSDSDKFRVFCITRCIPQKEAAETGLELVDGYNTVQQKNYYDYFIQLSQVYWNKYTLSLPPFEIINFREIQPYAPDLAEYNVKYIISPYSLKDKNFILEKKFNSYFVYKNKIVQPRAYFKTETSGPLAEAQIINYSANQITVDASKHKGSQIVLAEVYNKDWNAYLNGTEKTDILQPHNKLRVVNIKPNTKFVDFKYEPTSFIIGRTITITTVFLIFTYLIAKWRKFRHN